MHRLEKIVNQLSNKRIRNIGPNAVISASLEKLARDWVQYDPDPITRKAVEDVLKSGDEAKLKSLFEPRIAFGTAGLRAAMAPGYHNINQLVILQTTQGLIRYMEVHQPNFKQKGVIIGYDGRHNSRTYASLAAAIFLSENVPVYLTSTLCCTPLVPFGVKTLNLAAGVMVTASHNPKNDNGYKLYWCNGAQIIPPHDSGISAAIQQNLKPWRQYKLDPAHPLLKDPFAALTEQYMSEIGKRYSFTKSTNRETKLRVTYTAMHGVGAYFVKQAFERFNLHPYIPVKEQIEPDPEFPTVAFPNPEEGKGALALSMQTADRNGSPLVLACDPDADRLAVAEKDLAKNEWIIFNGNQIALLFADWVWTNYLKKNPTQEQKKKSFMLASTVSSKILKSMAEKEGFTFVDTLTGFKWMGNVAYDMEQKGMNFLFAYEVEIGFLVGNLSWDKDGVRTAAIFNELAIHWYNQGVQLHQRLQQLYQKYGYFVMNPGYFFCDETSIMDRIFKRLRTMNQGTYPTHCGRFQIASVRDVTTGYDSSTPDKKSLLPRMPDDQMITFRFTNGGTCTMRNSGTEPKLKYYAECNAKTEVEARKATDELTQALIEEFMQPQVNGLRAKSS